MNKLVEHYIIGTEGITKFKEENNRLNGQIIELIKENAELIKEVRNIERCYNKDGVDKQAQELEDTYKNRIKHFEQKYEYSKNDTALVQSAYLIVTTLKSWWKE